MCRVPCTLAGRPAQSPYLDYKRYHPASHLLQWRQRRLRPQIALRAVRKKSWVPLGPVFGHGRVRKNKFTSTIRNSLNTWLIFQCSWQIRWRCRHGGVALPVPLAVVLPYETLAKARKFRDFLRFSKFCPIKENSEGILMMLWWFPVRWYTYYYG